MHSTAFRQYAARCCSRNVQRYSSTSQQRVDSVHRAACTAHAPACPREQHGDANILGELDHAFVKDDWPPCALGAPDELLPPHMRRHSILWMEWLCDLSFTQDCDSWRTIGAGSRESRTVSDKRNACQLTLQRHRKVCDRDAEAMSLSITTIPRSLPPTSINSGQANEPAISVLCRSGVERWREHQPGRIPDSGSNRDQNSAQHLHGRRRH